VLLDILVGEGTTVQAGSLLAWIGESGESAPAGEQPAASPTPSNASRDLGFISPVVSRIAAEHAIDLSQVSGTGQGGRITKKDVLAYLESAKSPALPISPAPLPPVTRTPEPSSRPAPPATPGELLPMTPLRRMIAEHMLHSKHTSPHVTTVMEVDLSHVVSHREANKAAFSRDGANLTFTAYFIAAAVAALKAHPIVNSSWSDEGIRLHRQIHIGMATSLGEEGLIVPVIHNADRLSLLGLAQTINDLAARARAKKLQPD
jgi:2-oxoglutarate dehydrogenase E2 component (dihydrolipoamide succinyltransferase)